MTLAELDAVLEAVTSPGPIRAAALDAGAARLRMDVGVCGDRCRTATAHVLADALIGARAAIAEAAA